MMDNICVGAVIKWLMSGFNIDYTIEMEVK